MQLRWIAVVRLIMIFQNNKTERICKHPIFDISCSIVLWVAYKKFTFLRCRVWMQWNYLLSPNIFIFWGTLELWMMIINQAKRCLCFYTGAWLERSAFRLCLREMVCLIVSQLWPQALTDCSEIWNQSFWYIGAVGSRNVFKGSGGVTLEKEGIRGLSLWKFWKFEWSQTLF